MDNAPPDRAERQRRRTIRQEQRLRALQQQPDVPIVPANMANNDQLNAVLAALQQNMAALAQGQVDLATAIQGLAPAPAGPVPFHLSPAQCDPTTLVDLRSRSGKAIYEETQKGRADKYNLSKADLSSFVKDIQAAALRLACRGTAATTVCEFTPADGDPTVNIIDHYGEVTVDRIKDQSLAFITGATREERQAQNNTFMVDYTLNSLTREARDSLLVYDSKFTVDGKIVWGLLWKQLISVPSLDSKLTARNLRAHIRSLPDKMADHTIKSFNLEFTSKVDQLLARKETIDDLEDIVLSAYQVTADSRFNDYFKRQKEDIDDGEGPLANADYKEILAKGLEKFNVFKDDWGKLSKQEEDFIALKFTYERQLGDLRGKLELKAPAYAKGSSKKSKGKSNSDSAGSFKPAKAGTITKNKKPTGDRQRQKRDEAWKKVPPKDRDPHSKTVDGSTWNWCVHHMSWVKHSSDQCDLGKRRAQEQQKGYKANSATFLASNATTTDPVVKHQQDFMAKLAGLSSLE